MEKLAEKVVAASVVVVATSVGGWLGERIGGGSTDV